MIDTDKYALVIDDDGYFCEDKIADLLAEVKRLQEENKRLQDAISQCGFGDLEHSCQDNLPEEIVDRLNLPYYGGANDV